MKSNIALCKLSFIGMVTLQLFCTIGFCSDHKSVYDMSLEELMDVTVVVSGNKREESIFQSSIPITVVSGDDIHYSGQTNLAEVLQFTLGVDIVQLDKRRYAIGIRGLHGFWSDRVKLLVDGRNADSIAYGGPEFRSLTIHIEDIERIEVVRGPAGGAWGANAFTGVINIITKKPDDVMGVMLSSTVNEFGDSYSHLRWADQMNDLAFRGSISYEGFEDSSESLGDPVGYDSWATAGVQALAGVSTYEPRDFGRFLRVDTDFTYDITDVTSLRYGFGYRHNELGSAEIQGYLSRDNSNEDYFNSFIRLDHTYESGSKIFVQYYNRYLSNYNSTIENRSETFQNVIEGQYDFTMLENHETSIGVQAEYNTLNFMHYTNSMMNFRLEDSSEYSYGAFLIDKWGISDRFWTEQQFRIDEYSETHSDWAGRLAVFFSIDDEREHVFRVAAARAYRTPLVVLRENTGQFVPVGGGLFLSTIERTPGLDNERTCSIEAGYSGQFSKDTIFNINAYIQKYDDLIGYVTTTDGFGLQHVTPYNLKGADSQGIEAELTFKGENNQLSLWYAFNDFDADNPDQSLRAYLPSKHKFGATYRMHLEKDWIFNVNFKQMNNTYFNDAAETIAFDEISRLDLTLSKHFEDQNCEILFGIKDVLDQSRMGATETNSLSSHDIPGRTFFARMQLWF